MRLTAFLPLTPLASITLAAFTGLTTTPYTDPLTSIPFSGISLPQGYRFGILLPPSTGNHTSNTFIAQLVGPLSPNSPPTASSAHPPAGWTAIDFGKSMIGPLLIVAWPSDASPSGVMLSARQAKGKSVASVDVYDGGKKGPQSLSFKIISKGTWVNNTAAGGNFGVTFVCEGCMGREESFDPVKEQTGEWSWVWSSKKVRDPSTEDTLLSDHGGVAGRFGVDFETAKNGDFERWVKLADEESTGSGMPVGTGTGGQGVGSATGTMGSAVGTGKSSGADGGMGGSFLAVGAVGGLWLMKALVGF